MHVTRETISIINVLGNFSDIIRIVFEEDMVASKCLYQVLYLLPLSNWVTPSNFPKLSRKRRKSLTSKTKLGNFL